MVFGWTIWEWKGVWVEAEFHGVVYNDGQMTDITPHDGEEQILFLPDRQGKSFDGRTVQSVMEPLSDDPLVLEYLREADNMNRIRTQITNERRQPRMDELLYFQRVAALQLRLYQKQGIDPVAAIVGAMGVQVGTVRGQPMRVGRNAPCPCGSGKKFKHCCIGRN